jgi:NAD(P)-dependent dehydrogenase (short-subunit alcohol dehydrogenase family)
VLKKSAKPRIVNVGALAHRAIKAIDFNNLNWDKDYNTIKAYSQSKLFNTMFTCLLAKKV